MLLAQGFIESSILCKAIALALLNDCDWAIEENKINKEKKQLRILQISTLRGKVYFVGKKFKALLGEMVGSWLITLNRFILLPTINHQPPPNF